MALRSDCWGSVCMHSFLSIISLLYFYIFISYTIYFPFIVCHYKSATAPWKFCKYWFVNSSTNKEFGVPNWIMISYKACLFRKFLRILYLNIANDLSSLIDSVSSLKKFKYVLRTFPCYSCTFCGKCNSSLYVLLTLWTTWFFMNSCGAVLAVSAAYIM